MNPPGLRYIGKSNDNWIDRLFLMSNPPWLGDIFPRNIAIIEFPPQKRTLIFNKGKRYNHLYFPYTIFIIKYSEFLHKLSFRGLWVYVRPLPLTTLFDKVHNIPLPNMTCDISGGVCLGNAKPQGTFKDLKGLTDRTVEAFWSSEFSEEFYILNHWDDQHYDWWFGGDKCLCYFLQDPVKALRGETSLLPIPSFLNGLK